MPVDFSTDSETGQSSSPTQVLLPMAGSMPMAYRRAWRQADEGAHAASSAPATGSELATLFSPTGSAAAQATGLSAAADPVAEQAVMRPLTPLPVRLRVMERWDGVVLDLHLEEGFFTARVVPLGRREPELYVDFRFDKVDEQDRPIVEVGALFYAISGYIPIGPGERIQASSLRFRRLAKWRAEDVEFMRASASKRRAALGLHDEE